MLKEACGIFGIYDHKDSINLTLLGLYALQHRGQESSGIIYRGEVSLQQVKNLGLVSNLTEKFDNTEIKSKFAIGHTRYSTTGESNLSNVQPLLIESGKGFIGIAHNGNIVNSLELRESLENEGAIFQTTIDTEVILHLIARSKKKDLVEAIIEVLKQVKGGFSLLIIYRGGIIAARDCFGIKPLSIGKLGKSTVVASESCAFDLIEAEYVRDIEPGELVVINDEGVKSCKYNECTKKANCIFELIYFARPDSYVFGHRVYSFREKCGRQMAKKYPVEADNIVAVPDSGIYSTIGFSRESKINFEMGLVRNHYTGRTFIKNTNVARETGVRMKLSPLPDLFENRRVILIDDSIVRGITLRNIIDIIKKHNPKELHVRIASPPYIYSCYYGIDTAADKELVAKQKTSSEMAEEFGIDSLEYLQIDHLLEIFDEEERTCFCTACFNNEYPVLPEIKITKDILEKGDNCFGRIKEKQIS